DQRLLAEIHAVGLGAEVLRVPHGEAHVLVAAEVHGGIAEHVRPSHRAPLPERVVGVLGLAHVPGEQQLPGVDGLGCVCHESSLLSSRRPPATNRQTDGTISLLSRPARVTSARPSRRTANTISALRLASDTGDAAAISTSRRSRNGASAAASSAGRSTPSLRYSRTSTLA